MTLNEINARITQSPMISDSPHEFKTNLTEMNSEPILLTE